MEKKKIILINTSHKGGPKVDHCGITVLIPHQELNDEHILVRCFLRLR